MLLMIQSVQAAYSDNLKSFTCLKNEYMLASNRHLKAKLLANSATVWKDHLRNWIATCLFDNSYKKVASKIVAALLRVHLFLCIVQNLPAIL